MPYRFIDEIATADVAFKAEGSTIEEVFTAACEATLNTMIENLSSIERKIAKSIRLESDTLDMLLFDLLQELIYYKDAEQLFLKVTSLFVAKKDAGYSLIAEMHGEKIDPQKHNLIVDVKAVTLYSFKVERTPTHWQATVVLDV